MFSVTSDVSLNRVERDVENVFRWLEVRRVVTVPLYMMAIKVTAIKATPVSLMSPRVGIGEGAESVLLFKLIENCGGVGLPTPSDATT